jgi:hypothetical protein
MFRESPKLGVRVNRIPAAVPRLISYYVFAEQGNREHSGQGIPLLRPTFLGRSQLIAFMHALASEHKNTCSWQIKCTRIGSAD